MSENQPEALPQPASIDIAGDAVINQADGVVNQVEGLAPDGSGPAGSGIDAHSTPEPDAPAQDDTDAESKDS